MNAFSRKALTGAIGAIALAGAMAASAAPAEARSGRGAWIAGGLAAGLVGGALVASSRAHAYPVYGYGYEYAPTCWREARPIYDRFGNYVGQRRIRVCN